MFYSGESMSNSNKSDKRLQAGFENDMKINLLHYKNEEIKYANGLHQIPEMMDARQFYLNGMDDANHIMRIIDVAKSMDAKNSGRRNNRNGNTGSQQQRYGSMKQTKRIDRYGN